MARRSVPQGNGSALLRVARSNTLPYDVTFVDVCRRKSAAVLCQNCVTYPPKPWGNTVIYGDTSTHIVVG